MRLILENEGQIRACVRLVFLNEKWFLRVRVRFETGSIDLDSDSILNGTHSLCEEMDLRLSETHHIVCDAFSNETRVGRVLYWTQSRVPAYNEILES